MVKTGCPAPPTSGGRRTLERKRKYENRSVTGGGAGAKPCAALSGKACQGKPEGVKIRVHEAFGVALPNATTNQLCEHEFSRPPFSPESA